MNTKTVPLWIIILIVALPQLSETIYTPALPQLALGLNTSDSMAEYTLTTYLIGFAFGVLLWGGLSDRVGRKPILFVGLTLYMIASLGCYFSYSIESLLCFRFIQAFGASVGSVLGQAIARDSIKPADRGHAFSIISIAMAFAPALGPLLGGFVIQLTNWSFIFVFLCFIAGLIALLIHLFLPETNINIGAPGHKKSLFKACLKQMISDPRLLGFGFLVGGINGILFGYFAESPFFFIQSLNLSSASFGTLAFMISLPLALGGLISKNLHSKKYDANQIIHYGICTLILGAALFYLLTNTFLISVNNPTLAIIFSMLSIFIIMAGVTMVIPNCLSQALQDYGNYSGTAASIFGFYYYLLISIMTALMGFLHDGTLKALPLFILILSSSMMVVFRITNAHSNRKCVNTV